MADQLPRIELEDHGSKGRYVLRGAGGAVPGADEREETLHRCSRGGPRPRRADALRGLPPTAGRIRAEGGSLGGGQPGATEHQSIFRHAVVARRFP